MLFNFNGKHCEYIEKTIVIEKPNTITINNFDDTSARDFRESFECCLQKEQEFIPIYIDSPGGRIDSVFSMVDVIRHYQEITNIKVVTISIGRCMSAGTVLLSAGTKGFRYATNLSELMLHDMSSGSYGKTETIVTEAKQMQKIQAQYFQLFDENCDKKKGFFKNYFKEIRNIEKYITAKEAKDLNLVDHIGIPNFEFNVNYELKIV